MKKLLLIVGLFLMVSSTYAAAPASTSLDLYKPCENFYANQLKAHQFFDSFHLIIDNISSLSDGDFYISVYDNDNGGSGGFVFYGTLDEYNSSTPDLVDGHSYSIGINWGGSFNYVVTANLYNSSSSLIATNSNINGAAVTSQLGSNYYIQLSVEIYG